MGLYKFIFLGLYVLKNLFLGFFQNMCVCRKLHFNEDREEKSGKKEYNFSLNTPAGCFLVSERIIQNHLA
jgi:hypothetical protein